VSTLAESRALRFTALTALYFAQGIPWGFIAVGYVIFLTDQGLDNTAVGAAVGLGYVPWTFKVLWGPLIDRFPSRRFGRRRPYIVIAQLLMGVTILPLIVVDPKTQLGLIGALLVVHNTFAALQDVAVDALAVDILPPNERGTANSLMWAGKSGGVAVGGGAGTLLAKHLGWPALFVTIALLIWAIMLISVFTRERPVSEPAGEAPTPRLSFRELARSFTFRAPLVGIAIAMLTPVGYALVETVFTRTLRADLKLGEEAIAFLSGTVDPAGGIAGALVGGILADRLGKRRVMAGSMLVIAASLAVFAWSRAYWPSYGFLVGFVLLRTFAIHAFNAASLGFFMTLSNPAIGATQFAVFMASTNLTYSWASPAGGFLADRLGVAAAFGVAAVIQVITIALLPLCDPRTAEARFRGEQNA
jgi:MFS transporter, PAT family, beta-lactamase induction signal transducer AmpG